MPRSCSAHMLQSSRLQRGASLDIPMAGTTTSPTARGGTTTSPKARGGPTTSPTASPSTTGRRGESLFREEGGGGGGRREDLMSNDYEGVGGEGGEKRGKSMRSEEWGGGEGGGGVGVRRGESMPSEKGGGGGVVRRGESTRSEESVPMGSRQRVRSSLRSQDSGGLTPSFSQVQGERPFGPRPFANLRRF